MGLGEITAAVGRGFKGAARFSGRDARSHFWPYAIFLFLLNGAATLLAVVPLMMDLFERIRRFAIEHPEHVRVESGPGHYSIKIQGYHPELMPDLGGFALSLAVVGAATAALLAAAVVRRLHDRDSSGLWGLMPLPFLALGFALIPKLFSGFATAAPDMRLFFLLFLNNLCYLSALVALIVMLAKRGTPGPNRFGDDPAAPSA